VLTTLDQETIVKHRISSTCVIVIVEPLYGRQINSGT